MSMDVETTLQHLRDTVATFARERDWEQFHNPKGLAAAISIGAVELQKLFLWLSPVRSRMQPAIPRHASGSSIN